MLVTMNKFNCNNRVLIAFVGPKYSGKSTCCELTKHIFQNTKLHKMTKPKCSKNVNAEVESCDYNFSEIINNIINITFGLNCDEQSDVKEYCCKEMKNGITKLFIEQLPIYFPKLFTNKINVWKWIASHYKSPCISTTGKTSSVKLSIVKYSFAGPLKQIASIIFGIAPNSIYLYETKNIIIPNRYYTGRQIMQKLGDIYRIELIKIFRKLFNPSYSVWVYLMNKKICNTANTANTANTIIMIDDVRFPDEISLINSFRPNTMVTTSKTCTLVLTIKLSIELQINTGVNVHVSESHFDNIITDYIINNNKKEGLNSLTCKLRDIYALIR